PSAPPHDLHSSPTRRSSDLFFRIHNSFIINMTKIKEFLKTDGYVILQSNHKIPVSRQKKSDLLELIYANSMKSISPEFTKTPFFDRKRTPPHSQHLKSS